MLGQIMDRKHPANLLWRMNTEQIINIHEFTTPTNLQPPTILIILELNESNGLYATSIKFRSNDLRFKRCPMS